MPKCQDPSFCVHMSVTNQFKMLHWQLFSTQPHVLLQILLPSRVSLYDIVALEQLLNLSRQYFSNPVIEKTVTLEMTGSGFRIIIWTYCPLYSLMGTYDTLPFCVIYVYLLCFFIELSNRKCSGHDYLPFARQHLVKAALSDTSSSTANIEKPCL